MKREIFKNKKNQVEKQFCKCGCEEQVKQGRTWIKNHHMRGKYNPNHGKKFSLEHRQKLSNAHKGKVGKENGFYNKKHTKETKQKIRDAVKGKKNAMFGKKHTEVSKENLRNKLKGKTPWNKGLSLTIEHKNSLRKIMKTNFKDKDFIDKYSGENNHNWKGGIACEPYCEIWLDEEYKQSIRDRDGNQCLNPDCWETSNRLVIHHINYKKKDCHPKNLCTLCNSCNIRANKDRGWWKAWYKAIMYRRYNLI